jgi:hypothetical protein
VLFVTTLYDSVMSKSAGQLKLYVKQTDFGPRVFLNKRMLFWEACHKK